jgi:hypothetical protein
MTAPMRQPVLAAALALACAVVPLIASPAAKAAVRHAAHAPAPNHAKVGYTRPAERVLTQARAASGGEGWSMLRGWHETGHDGAAPYEAWFDPLRYGMRVETREAAGKRAHGYNGQGDWQILPDGTSLADDDPAGVAATRTEAFFGAAGYFHRARFDARGELAGVRNDHGRTFDAVLVKPWGGNARELWFDRRTHLLARMIDRSGARPVIQQFSDYRRIGPVTVAFQIAIDGPNGIVQRRRDAIVFAPSDRALFSLPRTVDATAPPP